MTLTADSGNTYRLCLLDTNIVSTLLRHRATKGRALLTRFRPADTAFCISIYTLIEVRRRADIWRSFLEFFGVFPFFLTKPHSQLIADEMARYPNDTPVMPAIYAFSPFNQGADAQIEHGMRILFGDSNIRALERRWRRSETEVLTAWLENCKTFKPTGLFPNARDALRYVDGAFHTALRAECPAFVERELEAGRLVTRANFPALQAMLYSMYYRLFDPHWDPKPGEVTDVQLAAAVPHVDAFVSEAFQIEIMRKIRRKVAGLDDVELVRLADL